MIRYFLLLFSLPLALSSLEKLDCYNVWAFDVNISNGVDARIYQGELSILFSMDKFRIFTHPNTNLVDVLLNDTIIIFKGELIAENSADSQKIAKASYYQALGTAKLEDAALQDCDIILLKDKSDRWNIPKNVEDEIRKRAEVCMIHELFKKLTVPYFSEFIVSADQERRHQVENPFSETERNLNHSINNPAGFQSYINHIVDIVLIEIINHLKKNHNEMIKIPNIDETFKIGSGIFETNGRFTTADGYFSDITTLKRTTDAHLDRNGYKLSASCGFGLTKALIEYNQYRLKFGVIKLDGVISAKIDGISIEANVSVDYNLKPCKTTIEYFKIVDYGKITINVTGLSPFNSLASTLATWISKKWQNEIISLIKAKITKIIAYELDKFDCEKFRI